MRKSNAFWLRVIAIVLMAFGGVADARADTPARKAGRGLAAMTTGFLEVPGNMVAETRRHGPGYGIPVGFVKGLGGIVVRELVGVYEFVTAPIEAPKGYRPILSPEFPWGYFDQREIASADPAVAVRSCRAHPSRGADGLATGAGSAACSERSEAGATSEVDS